ncbi:5-oxoprolinase subunit PxpB [Planomicrobium sp. CPCC 101079]|uniref:5-oxoprolinase subunit PxpB n=1 Tax=Planomicrobium sp. CPCC 101079 TaxID=2599618 RepID=UPI0011B4FBC0|nr:5-oxoprolinase subunit PxpB [Planomicrobium sp. CPCC 101079]TWT02516.1 5-oxoprolinase subunit PxpB [Planomicrobium sp. CPCC 101079]
MDYSFSPLGDQAIMIEIGQEISDEGQNRVRTVSQLLESKPPHWLIETIPAFTTVAVFYNPMSADFETVEAELKELLQQTKEVIASEVRTVEIPVCYGGDFGPDLEFVAEHNGLTPEEVIAIHTSGTYSVHMIGFAPGFPFIGGMSEKIAAPRRDSPRLRIPERTVGIAGKQTGVYPIETPGGWQLIGRTPVRLFRPENPVPSLLRAGDKIVFKKITESEYHAWKEEDDAENY